MIHQTQQDTIRLVTSSAATLDVNCTVHDSNLGRRRYLTQVSSATTTTIVPAPTGVSEVDSIIIQNTHASTSVDITLQLYNGTTGYAFYFGVLPAKHTLIFFEGGIDIYDNTGVAM